MSAHDVIQYVLLGVLLLVLLLRGGLLLHRR